MSKPTQKYLFLHRSEPGHGHGHGKPSPEQMQAMFAKWNAWKEKFKENIVDWGDKLKSEGKVVGTAGVTDGPFVEAKEIIGGFMIVSAESLEHDQGVLERLLGHHQGRAGFYLGVNHRVQDSFRQSGNGQRDAAGGCLAGRRSAQPFSLLSLTV